jgi:hypothetical protein
LKVAALKGEAIEKGHVEAANPPRPAGEDAAPYRERSRALPGNVPRLAGQMLSLPDGRHYTMVVTAGMVVTSGMVVTA